MTNKYIPTEEMMTSTNEEVDNNDSDTATVSYDEDDVESSTNSQYSYTTDDQPISMPILKYARLMGSLPRTTTETTSSDDNKNSNSATTTASPFTNKVTASTIGRVIIRPSQTDNNKHSDINNSNNSNGIEYNEEDETDKSLTKVHHVIALGYSNGEVKLVDITTGKSVLFGSTDYESGCWYVTKQPTKSSHKNRQQQQQGCSSSNKGGNETNQRITNLSFDS